MAPGIPDITSFYNYFQRKNNVLEVWILLCERIIISFGDNIEILLICGVLTSTCLWSTNVSSKKKKFIWHLGWKNGFSFKVNLSADEMWDEIDLIVQEVEGRKENFSFRFLKFETSK